MGQTSSAMTTTTGDLALYWRLLKQVWPYRWNLAGLLLLELLAAGMSLLAPLPLKVVVDSVVGTSLTDFIEANTRMSLLRCESFASTDPASSASAGKAAANRYFCFI